MSQNSRFKPPEAVVADIGLPVRRSIVAPLILALASLFHLDWVWINARTFIRLVSAGALSPIGLASAGVGLACLYIGLLLAVINGNRGDRALLMAAGCLGITMFVWRSFPDDGFPTIFGVTLAAAGWILVRARKRELSRVARADGGQQ